MRGCEDESAKSVSAIAASVSPQTAPHQKHRVGQLPLELGRGDLHVEHDRPADGLDCRAVGLS